MVTRNKIYSRDGESDLEYEIPEFMLEETAQKLLKVTAEQAKLSGADSKVLKKIFDEAATGNEDAAKFAAENKKGLETLQKVYKSEFGQKFNANFEKASRILGNTIQTALTAVGAIGAIAGGVVYGSLTNLGNALRQVTDVGIALGDNLSEMPQAASQTIMQLNRLGLTTDNAVKALNDYSRTFSVGGQQSTSQLMERFLELSNNGADFGKTILESKEMLLSELQARTRMIDISRLDQDLLSSNIVTTSLNLQKFATILGTNSNALLQNSQALIDGNAVYQTFVSGLDDPTQREQMRNQALNLMNGLQAVFDDAGGELGNAILEVAGTGLPQLNDTFREMSYINRDFFDEMVKTSNALRDGTLDIDPKALAERFQGMISSFSGSEADLRQIFIALGIEGSNTAKLMTDLSLAGDVASGRLNEFANRVDLMSFEDVQGGVTSLENAFNLFKGQMNLAANYIGLQFGPTFNKVAGILEREMGDNGSLTVALKEGGVRILNAITETFGFGEIFSPDGTYSGLNNAVDWLTEKITAMSEWIEGFIRGFGDKEPSEIMGNLISDLTSAVTTGVTEGIKLLFESEAVSDALAKGLTALFGVVIAKSAADAFAGSAMNKDFGDNLKNKTMGRGAGWGAVAAATAAFAGGHAVGNWLVENTGIEDSIGKGAFNLFGGQRARDLEAFRASLNNTASPATTPTTISEVRQPVTESPFNVSVEQSLSDAVATESDVQRNARRMAEEQNRTGDPVAMHMLQEMKRQTSLLRDLGIKVDSNF